MSKAIRSSGRRSFSGGKRLSLEPDLMSLMSLVEAKRFADVELAARRILARRPNQPLALKALSFALLGLARNEEALALLDHAVRRNPQDAELHNNQGIALHLLMRWEDSMVSFQRARLLTPDDPELLKNMAGALLRMEHWNEAAPILLEAIEKHPGDFVEAIELLAGALMGADRMDEAQTCLREICAADGTNLRAQFQLISCNLKLCRWDDLAELLDTLRARSDNFSAPLVSPFSALAFPGLSGEDHRRVAESFARQSVPSGVYASARALTGVSRAADRQRLRIGYLSGDFCMHPVGLIIPELMERHDHSRIEVFGYSTRADDGSEIRKRLMAAFDQFVDLVDMPVQQIAERIRQDQVDILIDLSGWTTGGRPEALAFRCAPVQVNWLGYAGTMGHPGLADYILGDRIATPIKHASAYTEQIAQLPHCYLPADTTGSIGERPPREMAGLPEAAFVFCSFNNSYKFNPPLFDLWCRVLVETPGSVLWLSHPGDSAAEALRGEVQRRGVEPGRLVFARRVVAHADHLARIQLADLALDTFPYNSHSTGMDTLRAGVPMVALQGEAFASRVGASLLRAAGLDELVVDTPEHYVELALLLCHDRSRLAALRQRLHAGNTSLPLFDMKAFARNLEDLYFRMWQNQLEGKREPIVAAPVVTAH